MTDPRVASADELLQALTVGDLSAADPVVAQRLAADPQLAERWRRLADTLARLRELDSGLRDGGTAPPATAGGREPADPRVDARAVVRAFRRRRHLRRTLGALAAVAAVLFAAWLLFAAPRRAADPTLGPAPATLQPLDGAAWLEGQPLRWAPMRGATGYRVQVRAAEGTPPLTFPDDRRGGTWFEHTEWMPTAAEREALPRSFQWRVIAFDESGPLEPSAWASTHR